MADDLGTDSDSEECAEKRGGQGCVGDGVAVASSPTIQGVGKATAAPVELDGWERLLLEEREGRSQSHRNICQGQFIQRHGYKQMWMKTENSSRIIL